jgi:hypothetical protein
MKKIIIAGSAKLQKEATHWVNYWQSKNFEVTDYPKKIEPSEFEKEYPDIYRLYFKRLLVADILFVMNEDRNGVRGYIGAETFAEMAFAVANNQLGKTKIEIVLLKKPSNKCIGSDDVNLWLKLDWIKIFK